MKVIKEYIDEMLEEIASAKCYAEKYVEEKARGNSTDANKYKEMSNDELKHANYIHDIALTKIDELENVFIAPEDMKEVWRVSHTKYVEKTAWVKTMLNM